MAIWIEEGKSINYSAVQRIMNGKGKEKRLREQAQIFHHDQCQEGNETEGKPSISEGGCRQRPSFCKSEIFTAPTRKLGKLTSAALEGQRKGGRHNKLTSVHEELRYKMIEMLYKERTHYIPKDFLSKI